MPDRYRKRPVVIEATVWLTNGDHPDDGPNPEVEGAVVRRFRRPEPEYAGQAVHESCGRIWHDHGWIDTLEGGHTVCPGDYIITGVQGERYSCKPDIFEATYERVEPAEPDCPAILVTYTDGVVMVKYNDMSLDWWLTRPDVATVQALRPAEYLRGGR